MQLFELERPLRPSSTTITQHYQIRHVSNPSINHIPKCHIYTSLKSQQGWGLRHWDSSPWRNSFSHVSEAPLAQLKDVQRTRSASCHPAFPGPFLQSNFPTTHPQACAAAWGQCDSGAAPGTWPYWRHSRQLYVSEAFPKLDWLIQRVE